MGWVACYAKRAATIVAILLALTGGVVTVCFGVPLAYGIGCDIAARPGLIATAAVATAAILLWRLLRRSVPQAAKSIT